MTAGGGEGKRNAQALFLLYVDAVSVVASRRAELRGPKPEDAAGRTGCARWGLEIAGCACMQGACVGPVS